MNVMEGLRGSNKQSECGQNHGCKKDAKIVKAFKLMTYKVNFLFQLGDRAIEFELRNMA